MKWTANNIQDLTGKVAIVTGANSGLGFETTKALAAKGATVIMACRNMDKANHAAAEIRSDVPEARLELRQLDLADLASVRTFAETFKAEHAQLHLLINNAGVMIPPFSKSKDGFEIQFAANHLGHFALTGLLLDVITRTPQARVVNVSSAAHRQGKMDWKNLQSEKGYKPWQAYGRSKLANLLFTYELQRRFEAAKVDTIAVAAHPGGTKTNLQAHVSPFMNRIFNMMMQEMPMGALPSLYAATASDVQGADYYGPDGFMEIRGYPKKVKSNADSHNQADAAKLWQISEELSQVSYNLAS